MESTHPLVYLPRIGEQVTINNILEPFEVIFLGKTLPPYDTIMIRGIVSGTLLYLTVMGNEWQISGYNEPHIVQFHGIFLPISKSWSEWMSEGYHRIRQYDPYSLCIGDTGTYTVITKCGREISKRFLVTRVIVPNQRLEIQLNYPTCPQDITGKPVDLKIIEYTKSCQWVFKGIRTKDFVNKYIFFDKYNFEDETISDEELSDDYKEEPISNDDEQLDSYEELF